MYRNEYGRTGYLHRILGQLPEDMELRTVSPPAGREDSVAWGGLAVKGFVGVGIIEEGRIGLE